MQNYLVNMGLFSHYTLNLTIIFVLVTDTLDK